MQGPEKISASDFKFLQDLVRRRSSIVIDDGKEFLAESRLAPVVWRHQLGHLGELMARIQQEPHGALAAEALDLMTTNETWFFRDLHPFDTLRLQVLPALIQSRAATRVLTFWSAAASSGQEAYSLAMLVRHHFPQLAAWRIQIFGTDISDRMVEKARSGIYNQSEINRGLPLALLMRYFDQQGREWRLRDEIRSAVSFQKARLDAPVPNLPKFDVVLLRNVLIYFDEPTKAGVLTRVAGQMKQDGALFLGSSETVLHNASLFETVSATRGCYYRPKPLLGARHAVTA